MKLKQLDFYVFIAVIVSILITPLGGCVSLLLGKDAKESKRITEQIINCDLDLAIANLTPMKSSSRELTRSLAFFMHALILEDQGQHQAAKSLYPHLIDNGYLNDADIDVDLSDGLRDLRKERTHELGFAECP